MLSHEMTAMAKLKLHRRTAIRARMLPVVICFVEATIGNAIVNVTQSDPLPFFAVGGNTDGTFNSARRAAKKTARGTIQCIFPEDHTAVQSGFSLLQCRSCWFWFY
jgi:hypothetical protein